MNKTIKLLDKYTEICSARTDNEIAAKLHVTKSAVSNWRREKAHPDAESVEKMARTINEPVGPWLAAIEAERARTPAARQVWLRLAATLGGVLTVAIVILSTHHQEAFASAGLLLFDITNRHSRTFAVGQRLVCTC